jgi:hypothetical protein
MARAAVWVILTVRSLPPLPRILISRACRSVVGVVPDGGHLRQPDAGGAEGGDDRGVAALGEAVALAGGLQPR